MNVPEREGGRLTERFLRGHSDVALLPEERAVLEEAMSEVKKLPARTTVQSVLWNDIKVEIDVVARKPA